MGFTGRLPVALPGRALVLPVLAALLWPAAAAADVPYDRSRDDLRPFRIEAAFAGGVFVPFSDSVGGAGTLEVRFSWLTRPTLRQGLRISLTGGALAWGRGGDDGGHWWVAGGTAPGGIGKRATFLPMVTYLVQYEPGPAFTLEFSTGMGAWGFLGSTGGNQQPWISTSSVGLAGDFWVHRGPRSLVAVHLGFDLSWFQLMISPMPPVMTPRLGIVAAF